MNDNQPEAMIAVQEERIRIGAAEVAKKTVIATTPDGGVVACQITTGRSVENLSAPPAVEPRAPAPVARPAVQPSQAVVVVDESPPPSSEFSCVDCCCRCDSDYKWYHPQGKGFCIVLLLLLGYLIFGCFVLVLFVLYLVCLCLSATCRND